MTLTAAKNKKKNLGTICDMLNAMGYPKRTNLEFLEAEYDKIDTALFNLNVPKTVTDDRVILDEKYNFVGYVE